MPQTMQRINQFLIRYESVIFWLVALASLYPVLILTYTASLDAPKHFSASNILGHWWLGDEKFKIYFALRPIYTGNVAGIYLLALFNLFLPAWLAGKLFVATYLLSFAASFRYLVRSFSSKASALVLLIFPFTHTSLWMMGYYNFSLAFVWLFLGLGYWRRHFFYMGKRALLVLTMMLIFTYLTHIFVFYILLFVLFWQLVSGSYIQDERRFHWCLFWKNSGRLLLASAPALLLSGFYVAGILAFQQSESLRSSGADKLADLVQFRMMTGYDLKAEIPVTRLLFTFLAILSTLVFGLRIKGYFTKNQAVSAAFFRQQDVWLILTFFFLLLYFVMPDGADAAGSVGMRMLIVVALFWVFWLALETIPSWIQFAVAVCVIAITIQLRMIHLRYLKPLDRAITEIAAAEAVIPVGSTVVTMNFSKNWLMHYFQHYVGMEKPLIDLRGNSCSPFMAFDWRNGRPELFADTAVYKGFTGYALSNGHLDVASHVVIIDYRSFLKEETQTELRRALGQYYHLIETTQSQSVAVFQRTEPSTP